jgi:predicted outer membrane repeat protein
VFCEHASPTIRNCVFTNNEAVYGGAIACRDSSSITLSDCVLSGNTAFRGAGLHCDGDGSPTLTDCAFTANTCLPHADGSGAGLQCANGCAPVLAGCSFTDNTAWRDAGMVCARNCSPVLTGCTFSGNTASEGAGGFGGYHNCAAEFTDCVFTDNAVTADVPVCAGGLLASLSELVLTRCDFLNNTAWSTGTEVVGGLSCFMSTPATLTECLFAGNSAGGGTGTYVGAVGSFSESPLELLRCTFSANEGDLGAVLCYEDGMAVLTECTFHGNSAGPDHGTVTIGQSTVVMENTILASATAGRAVECLSGDPPTLTCCDVFGNAGGDWVGCIAGLLGVDGNICEDPLFCDPPSGDFALQEDSPCAPFSAPNPECDLIGAWPVGCGTSSAGEHDPLAGQGLDLGPGVPNPFHGGTQIAFRIPGTAGVTLAQLQIYDATGRRIRELAAGALPPGVHSVRWDGTNQAGARVAAGIYYCRLTSGGEHLVRPLVLVD